VVSRQALTLVALALAAATLVLYLPVRHFDFIGYDDPGYIQENWVVQEGLSRQSVTAAFGSFQQGFWTPLTWLSYQADSALYGTGPSGYHVTNAVLHALNALLLLVFLESCTGMLWPAAAAAALLAFHPLHVESVAWITERKDVLSLFLGLLCLLAYVRYVRRPSRTRYAVVFALLAAALAAKPMMITIPVLMLLLDWWPLNRPCSSLRRIVGEKLPLLAIAAVSAVLTWLGHLRIEALTDLGESALSSRLSDAGAYLGFYLGKAIWPVNLGLFYLDPGARFGPLMPAGSIIIVIGITAATLLQRRRWPAGLAGWLWYIVGLLPVIGLVRPGDQMVADRFTYLPLIGISVALAWGIRSAVRSRPALARGTMAVGYALAVGGFAAETRLQLLHWRSGDLLFAHAVEVSPRSQIAQAYLATSLAGSGRPSEAEAIFRRLLAGEDRSFLGWRDYGVLLHRQGRYAEALAAFEKAGKLKPRDEEVVLFEGMSLLEAGDREGAEARFRRALAMRPKNPDTLANLATLLAETQREDEAEQLFREALAVDSHQPLASRNLDVLRAKRASRYR